MTIPLVIGVNPLQTTLLQLGIVSGRVALLLRSTEIHPVLLRFVLGLPTGSPPLPSFITQNSREGSKVAYHKAATSSKWVNTCLHAYYGSKGVGQFDSGMEALITVKGELI